MADNSYIKLLSDIKFKEYKGKLDQQVYEGLTGQLTDEQEQENTPLRRIWLIN